MEAWYCRWERRLVSCERRSVVLETAVIRLRAGGTLCDLPAVSCRVRFILDIGEAAATVVAVSSCCDDSSGLLVVATELSYSRRTFLLARLVPDNGRDFCSVKLGLGSWQC